MIGAQRIDVMLPPNHTRLLLERNDTPTATTQKWT